MTVGARVDAARSLAGERAAWASAVARRRGAARVASVQRRRERGAGARVPRGVRMGTRRRRDADGGRGARRRARRRASGLGVRLSWAPLFVAALAARAARRRGARTRGRRRALASRRGPSRSRGHRRARRGSSRCTRALRGPCAALGRDRRHRAGRGPPRVARARRLRRRPRRRVRRDRAARSRRRCSLAAIVGAARVEAGRLARLGSRGARRSRPYLVWIALGQNLRDQPRHALPARRGPRRGARARRARCRGGRRRCVGALGSSSSRPHGARRPRAPHDPAAGSSSSSSSRARQPAPDRLARLRRLERPLLRDDGARGACLSRPARSATCRSGSRASTRCRRASGSRARCEGTDGSPWPLEHVATLCRPAAHRPPRAVPRRVRVEAAVSDGRRSLNAPATYGAWKCTWLARTLPTFAGERDVLRRSPRRGPRSLGCDAVAGRADLAASAPARPSASARSRHSCGLVDGLVAVQVVPAVEVELVHARDVGPRARRGRAAGRRAPRCPRTSRAAPAAATRSARGSSRRRPRRPACAGTCAPDRSRTP